MTADLADCGEVLFHGQEESTSLVSPRIPDPGGLRLLQQLLRHAVAFPLDGAATLAHVLEHVIDGMGGVFQFLDVDAVGSLPPDLDKVGGRHEGTVKEDMEVDIEGVLLLDLRYPDIFQFPVILAGLCRHPVIFLFDAVEKAGEFLLCPGLIDLTRFREQGELRIKGEGNEQLEGVRRTFNGSPDCFPGLPGELPGEDLPRSAAGTIAPTECITAAGDLAAGKDVEAGTDTAAVFLFPLPDYLSLFLAEVSQAVRWCFITYLVDDLCQSF